MKRHALMIVLIGLLLAACVPVTATSPAAPATPAAAPTAISAAPTAAPMPTAAPVLTTAAAAPMPTTAAPAAAATVAPAVKTAAPAVESKRSAEFGGVSFTYPAGLAKGIEGKQVAADAGGTDAPWWMAVPRHTEVGLSGYVLTGTLMAPAVMVYPAAELAASNNEAAARITALRQLLADKPANPAGQLPFIPLFNAAQAMHAGVEYVVFPNGHGVRYLTQYAQGLMPINNRELVYTFQGLTDDGKFYVAAVLPISHASLPASTESMSKAQLDAMAGDLGKNYPKYVGDVAAGLNAQPGASFKPSLPDLDSMIKTLQIAASAS